MENELTTLGGWKPKCFANIDMSHCYWKLLLALKSQECQSIITPDSVFTPSPVLRGTTNAVTHVQSSLDAIIPDELMANILLWQDHILLYVPSEEELLTSIQLLFGLRAKIVSNSTQRIVYSTLLKSESAVTSSPRTGSVTTLDVCTLFFHGTTDLCSTSSTAPLLAIVGVAKDSSLHETHRPAPRLYGTFLRPHWKTYQTDCE